MASKAKPGESHSGSCLQQIYIRLLADVSHKIQATIVAPDDIDISWLLIGGPLLDKQLLRWIEGDADFPLFPDWMQILSERFRSTLDPFLLKMLRQLLVFCYKAEFEPTNEQIHQAQQAYEDVEECNRYWSWKFNHSQEYNWLHSTARQDVSKVIGNILWSRIAPSHGPGSVFPTCASSEKSDWDHIYTTIDEKYPFCDNFCLLPNYWKEACWHNPYLIERDVITCNLVAVPKDSRGPRLISVHPKEAIWIQQGQRKLLESAILRHPLTRGRINFHDQSINGALALSSSSTRAYCTLDLKDASDRLTCSLVKYLFGGAYPWISSARAVQCKLFDGKHIVLEKFAPMGNCLTFPVQSLVFFSLVRAGIRCRYGIDCNDVYVFGDDIVFPSEYYDGAVSGLTDSNLVVNTGKTFRHGLFRESCGVDAFNGINVTPHRLRGHDITTASTCLSLCALAKAMRIDGYDETSAFLYKRASLYAGPLLLNNDPDAQGAFEYVNWDLGKLLRYGVVRFNRNLHRWESKILKVSSLKERRSRDDWYHLQDSLNRLEGINPQLSRGGSQTPRYSHMEISDRAGGLDYPVPYRERLTYGWTPTL